MGRPIIVLGTKGNCVDILEMIGELKATSGAPRYECLGFLDDDDTVLGKEIAGCKVLGPLDAAPRFPEALFVNGIGSSRSFWKKEEIIARTRTPVSRFETLIHPSAWVSPTARLGRGTVVFQHVTITSNVEVGDHVVILPGSVLSHDVRVGDYVCVAGGACVSGGVRIGRSSYLGARSCVAEGVTIGERCLVGIGSVVLRDVAPGSIVVGNPARFLRSVSSS